MKIYLQSFFSEPLGYPFSVARFQPSGYNYPDIIWMKPLTKHKNPIKSKNPQEFMENYCNTLLENFDPIVRWLEETYNRNRDITLCCWCNKERQPNRKMLCHTILLGYFLDNMIKKFAYMIEIEYLDGRDNPIWTKEEFLNTIRNIIAKKTIKQK